MDEKKKSLHHANEHQRRQSLKFSYLLILKYDLHTAELEIIKLVIIFTMKSEMRIEEYHTLLLHVIIKRRVLIKMTKHPNYWHFINHTIFSSSSSCSEWCFQNREHPKWSYKLICILQRSYFLQNCTLL